MRPHKIIRTLLSTITGILLILTSCSRSGPDPTPPGTEDEVMQLPRGELRAVWMTTAWELDWPRGNYDPQVQRELYVERLELLQRHHFNTLFFQVRPMGDAFYDSIYEPWSEYITGERGKDPGYDLLRFLITEAHKRGIEFHAWINPYRIDTRGGRGESFAPLHPSIPKEWVWELDKVQMYNPGLPEVRQRLLDIIDELLSKYPDIDGIHFDDYFYPETSQGSLDDREDYETYGADFSTIADFRRANVNALVSSVSKLLREKYPSVTFSISPGSNYEHNLKDLYADVAHWCQSGWLDLLIPQLYQPINPESSAGFFQRMMWFCQFSYKTPVAAGHGLYRVGEAAFSADAAEIFSQILMTRKESRVCGGVFYRMQDLVDNRGGIQERLTEAYPTVIPLPPLTRVEQIVPPLTGLRLEDGHLGWTRGTTRRAVVYYTPTLSEVATVVDITDQTTKEVSRRGYYAVAALDDDNRQSDPSVVLRYQ